MSFFTIPGLTIPPPVVQPSLGLSLFSIPPLATPTSAPQPLLATPTSVVQPLFTAPAPIAQPSLPTPAPVTQPSLGLSLFNIPPLATPTSVVQPSLVTPAPITQPSLGLSLFNIPPLATPSPVAQPSLGIPSLNLNPQPANNLFGAVTSQAVLTVPSLSLFAPSLPVSSQTLLTEVKATNTYFPTILEDKQIQRLPNTSFLKLGKAPNDSTKIPVAVTMRSTPVLTKYELTKILGQRAEELDAGKEPLIEISETDDTAMRIAKKEFLAKRLPVVIQRYFPDGSLEEIAIDKLAIPRALMDILNE